MSTAPCIFYKLTPDLETWTKDSLTFVRNSLLSRNKITIALFVSMLREKYVPLEQGISIKLFKLRPVEAFFPLQNDFTRVIKRI